MHFARQLLSDQGMTDTKKGLHLLFTALIYISKKSLGM